MSYYYWMSGSELLLPDVLLDVLTENTMNYVHYRIYRALTVSLP